MTMRTTGPRRSASSAGMKRRTRNHAPTTIRMAPKISTPRPSRSARAARRAARRACVGASTQTWPRRAERVAQSGSTGAGAAATSSGSWGITMAMMM